jgi:hypothetical protein
VQSKKFPQGLFYKNSIQVSGKSASESQNTATPDAPNIQPTVLLKKTVQLTHLLSREKRIALEFASLDNHGVAHGHRIFNKKESKGRLSL